MGTKPKEGRRNMRTKYKCLAHITSSIFVGCGLGTIAGYLVGSLETGLFLFINICLLYGMGRFTDSEKNVRPRTWRIGKQKNSYLLPKTWSMWLYPMVIATWVVVILFVFYAIGGDPATAPVSLIY